MQTMSQTWKVEKPKNNEYTTFNTTLYELIEAIENEIDPAENIFLPVIIADLFDRGLIRVLALTEKSVMDFSIN
jgi:hypothetical protein